MALPRGGMAGARKSPRPSWPRARIGTAGEAGPSGDGPGHQNQTSVCTPKVHWLPVKSSLPSESSPE